MDRRSVKASVNTLDDLPAPSVRVIAIARLNLAPYGNASARHSRRLVFGEQFSPRWCTEKLGVVARSKNIVAAPPLCHFLLNGEGRDVARSFGYA